MYRYTTLSIFLAGSLALPHAAAAMDSGTHSNDMAPPAQQDAMEKPAIPQYHQPGEPITADKIQGMSVMTSDGTDVGTVHNIILNKNGQITHLVVDTGNTIDNGNLIAVPWQLVEQTHDFVMTPGDNPLHIRVSKSVMNGAPTIKGRDFPLPHADSSLKLANYYFRKALSKQNDMGQTVND